MYQCTSLYDRGSPSVLTLIGYVFNHWCTTGPAGLNNSTIIRFCDNNRMSHRRRLSVHKHQVGYWKGYGDKSEFVGLTNFNLELCKFVEAPPALPTFKGYIAKAMQLGRKHRLCEG